MIRSTGEPHPPGHRKYELRDISPRSLFIAGGLLTVLIVGALFVARWTYNYFIARQPASETVPTALRGGRQPSPPGPLLQIDAPGDLRRFRESENARLTSYGRDPLTGFIHIPVERAKQLLLARGLPVRQTGPPPTPGPPTQANPGTRPAV